MVLADACTFHGKEGINSVYNNTNFDFNKISYYIKYCAKDENKSRYLCDPCRRNWKIITQETVSEEAIIGVIKGDSNDKIAILKNLTNDCDSRISCIHDIDSIEEILTVNLGELVTLNYCSQSPMLNRSLCAKCASNYKKIKYYLDKDDIHSLAKNWDSPFDENIHLNTMRILRYKHYEADPTWKIKCINGFDKNLDDYFEELKDYDVLAFGDFKQSLLPLRKLPNLKGIIGGIWFFSDINELSGLKNLEFIYVGKLYNRHLEDDIYNITYVIDTRRL